MLTPQGKIVAVFDQKLLDPDTCIWLADGYVAEDLRKKFAQYAPFSKTGWEEVNLPVYYDLDGDLEVSEDVEAGVYVFPQEKGKIVVGGEFEVSVSDEEFTRFRLDHDIPLHGVDFTDEMLLNVFPEGYVSYTKGCFVGQEVIARVHNLASPPKKLVVKYEDQCTEQEKARLTSKTPEVEGRVRGFVFVDTEDKSKRQQYQALKTQFKK